MSSNELANYYLAQQEYAAQYAAAAAAAAAAQQFGISQMDPYGQQGNPHQQQQQHQHPQQHMQQQHPSHSDRDHHASRSDDRDRRRDDRYRDDRDRDRYRDDKDRDRYRESSRRDDRHDRRDERDGRRDYDRERSRHDYDRYRDDRRDRDHNRHDRYDDRRREERRDRDHARGDYERRDDKFRRTDRRDDRRERDTQREASPAMDENVVPLDKRQRKITYWDLAPPGCEGMTVAQMQQAGMLQPGMQSVSALTMPQMFPNLATRVAEGASAAIPIFKGDGIPLTANINAVRQSRRLYVGNVPYAVTEHEILAFMNEQMEQAKLSTESGPAIVAVQINHEKNFAFLEFRSPEETTAALALDGVRFASQSLKIRRPNDYMALPGATEGGFLSNVIPDTPNKLFIGGLPLFFDESAVREILDVAGPLKAFHLVMDGANSKGYAFCEYADPEHTEVAIKSLNDLQIQDRTLLVQRASIGKGAIATGAGGAGASYSTVSAEVVPTPILLLLNMVSEADLADPDEYDDIVADIREECSRFGHVRAVMVARPGERDVGRVFVEFDQVGGAVAANGALAGRTFAGRVVVASYATEADFAERYANRHR